MIQIGYNGEEIDIRTGFDEFKLGEVIDFQKKEDEYLNLIKEGGDVDEGVDKFVECVSMLVELPEGMRVFRDEDESGDLMTAKDLSVDMIYEYYVEVLNRGYLGYMTEIIGRVMERTYEMLDEGEKALVDRVFNYINDEGEFVESLDSIANLSLWLSERFGSGKVVDEGYEFYYKGDKWFVKNKDVGEWYSGAKYRVGQVGLVKEFRRRIKKKIVNVGDPDGMLCFRLGLYEMSVLCLKEGERIPVNPGEEQEKWIEDRMKYWEDVDLQVYYNVVFFLMSLSIVSGTGRITDMLLRRYKRLRIMRG